MRFRVGSDMGGMLHFLRCFNIEEVQVGTGTYLVSTSLPVGGFQSRGNSALNINLYLCILSYVHQRNSWLIQLPWLSALRASKLVINTRWPWPLPWCMNFGCHLRLCVPTLGMHGSRFYRCFPQSQTVLPRYYEGSVL